MNLTTFNKGDTLVIKDFFDLEESISSEYFNVEGIKYSVMNTDTFETLGKKKIYFWYLERQDKVEYILVSIDKKIFTLYRQLDEMPIGNRSDLLKAEQFWLFNQPEDENNYSPIDLVFCSEHTITYTTETDYNIVYNTTEFENSRNIQSKQPTSLYFYSEFGYLNNIQEDTEEERRFLEKFRHLLIVEEGGVDLKTNELNPDGGLIRVLVGRNLNPSEIDFFDDSK